MPAAQLGSRTAGEGSGHTARMHVPEESDSGILPMSHSNKDEQLSAESEEGRLLIRRTLFNLARTRHRAGLRGPRFAVLRRAARLAAIHPR